MCTCVHVSACICVCVHLCGCACVCTYVHVCLHTHLCLSACTCVCLCVRMCGVEVEHGVGRKGRCRPQPSLAQGGAHCAWLACLSLSPCDLRGGDDIPVGRKGHSGFHVSLGRRRGLAHISQIQGFLPPEASTMHFGARQGPHGQFTQDTEWKLAYQKKVTLAVACQLRLSLAWP